jgi:bifunctional non-homologous end joining protein LigD
MRGVPRVDIPQSGNAKLKVQGREVQLTNLDKPFWPELGITKGDLIQYYADVAPLLLPHIKDRAMVMKRYPHGAHGEFFFMKRAPSPRPDWIRTCRIDHDSGNVIDFPVIDDLPSLLWVINLGCIDLNQPSGGGRMESARSASCAPSQDVECMISYEHETSGLCDAGRR